jgi:hypothetical protein
MPIEKKISAFATYYGKSKANVKREMIYKLHISNSVVMAEDLASNKVTRFSYKSVAAFLEEWRNINVR